jgi:hypothetical protein
MTLRLLRSRWLAALVLLGAASLGLGLALATRSVMERADAMTARTAFDQPPVFIGMQAVAEGELKPFALALHQGRLLVSYLSSDRIDEFSDRLEYRRSLHLLEKAPASITGLAFDGDRLYAADFKSGDLLIVDYKSGKLLQSLGWLPDRKARMKALGVTYRGDNLYVTDVASGQIRVISATAVDKVRDEGELILSFPDRAAKGVHLAYPTWTLVTPDGRLLISDAKDHEVKAFTCSGRFAHLFETQGRAVLSAPMGIAMDDVPSPALAATAEKVFDPSGVQQQGRIHVVDAVLSRVKVFDALGKYVLTYGTELRQPNGIVIDPKARLILVSDAQLRAIAVYKY